MKKFFVLAALVISLLIPVLVCDAAEGNVVYSGNSGDFIYEPGSDESLTDLFSEFKNVMPGDVLNQKITIKNNAEKKVEIFLKVLGAADDDSADFLSKLRMQVTKSGGENIFDDKADQAMMVLEPVSLGEYDAGETADLDVKLIVPGELDNKYANKTGHLEWQFSVSEVADESKPESSKPESSAEESSSGEKQTSVVSQVSYDQTSTASGGAESNPGGYSGGNTVSPGGNDQPLNPAKTGEAAVFIVLLVLMAAAMGGVILAARNKNDKDDSE